MSPRPSIVSPKFRVVSPKFRVPEIRVPEIPCHRNPSAFAALARGTLSRSGKAKHMVAEHIADLFIMGNWGKPYTTDSLGKWLKRCCVNVGLADQPMHGLQMAAA